MLMRLDRRALVGQREETSSESSHPKKTKNLKRSQITPTFPLIHSMQNKERKEESPSTTLHQTHPNKEKDQSEITLSLLPLPSLVLAKSSALSTSSGSMLSNITISTSPLSSASLNNRPSLKWRSVPQRPLLNLSASSICVTRTCPWRAASKSGECSAGRSGEG